MGSSVKQLRGLQAGIRSLINKKGWFKYVNSGNTSICKEGWRQKLIGSDGDSSLAEEI